jgi:hypothetical protein
VREITLKLGPGEIYKKDQMNSKLIYPREQALLISSMSLIKGRVSLGRGI